MSIFVIAEIGINHNGDLDLAKQLIDVAVNAGADAVKFQKRDIDLVYTQAFLDGTRESQWGSTQRDQKAGLEFGVDEYTEIDAYCKNKDIEWFASAWDLNSLVFLSRYDLKYHKVASAMIVDEPFMEAVAESGRHTFISTGMSTVEDIDRAVELFRKRECPFELMHCISTYPMKDEDANLSCIRTLQERYSCDVGYSGHEVGLAVSYGAAALGITSLERHITLDRSMYGSDQSASVEPAGFRMLIGGLRKIDQAMGDGVLGMTQDEVPVSNKLREHIVGYQPR